MNFFPHFFKKYQNYDVLFCRESSTGGAKFCCDLCPQEFPVLSELLSHHKSEHKPCTRPVDKLIVQDTEEKPVYEDDFVNKNIKPDPENEESDPDEEIKSIVCDMELDLVEMATPNAEISGTHFFEEIRTKRKSPARAEELLVSILKPGTHDKDESDSDAGMNEEDTEPNYDSSKETDDNPDGIGTM